MMVVHREGVIEWEAVRSRYKTLESIPSIITKNAKEKREPKF